MLLLALFFLISPVHQTGTRTTPAGCLGQDGAVQQLRGYELGSLKLTGLGGGSIRYGAVEFRQGVCFQDILIKANRGNFLYGPAEDPLLQGDLTNLEIWAVNEGPSPTILNLKKSGFKATVRIAKYKVPALLGGTVKLPTQRVWIENTDALVLRTRVDGTQEATGLFSFETTGVGVTDSILELRAPTLSWKTSLQSDGPVRFSLDLSGQSLTLRRASFPVKLQSIAEPLQIATPSLNLRLDRVSLKRAMLDVNDETHDLHLEQFAATTTGVMTIDPIKTPVVLGGRWTVADLIARSARSKDAAVAAAPFEVADVINSAFASTASSAAVLAQGGGDWKDLLAAVGWLNPEAQRRRAIEDTRKQLANQQAPGLFVFLKREDIEPYMETRLKEVLLGVPVDLVFGKQEFLVGLAKGATPPVPLDFQIHLAPSIVESDLILRPSISIAALGNYATQNRAALATVWTGLVSRLRDYIQRATSEPIRVPLPKLTEGDSDLTKLKIQPPPSGPQFTVTVTKGDVRLGIKLNNPALIISPDGLRLLSEVAR
jgi:hypothetical protein